MVANNANTGSWTALAEQRRQESRNLTLARQGVNADLAPDLHAADRAVRVEAYRRQVEAAGRITEWLPAQATQRNRGRMATKGVQYRWFATR
ncbi:MAG: hypothetical protein BIFFINMI_04292 [Phycisphaerae bacterium]|nr:hypothetical protein [Phycisphaerae bacterium]